MGAVSADTGGTEGRRAGSDRLTDRACKAARAGKRPHKLFDGRGMYLLVQPSGAKLWRLKYRYGGAERVYAIGPYQEVPLAEARQERDRARAWLRAGLDPVAQRKLDRAGEVAKRESTFEAVATEFCRAQEWSAAHRVAADSRLKKELLPDLGRLPVAAITPAMVLATLKKIEARGALETASKCRVLASQIFRHAIITDRLQVDPAGHLSKAMQARKPVNRATIPLADMPALFRALAAVPAELNTKAALYWLILTAARTAEMRFATWNEIDAECWRVPAMRMKMRSPHIVRLSKQARAVLAIARPLRKSDDPGALIFPGFTRAGHLSENALLALLARAGFFGRQTSHGFRASFSSWAHEVHEADPDVIEACLAHVKEGVRGIYNRSAYLSKRAALLQAWANQCTAWGMRLP